MGNALPLTLSHHWCGKKLPSQIFGASRGQ
jgi:hypothetical protein